MYLVACHFDAHHGIEISSFRPQRTHFKDYCQQCDYVGHLASHKDHEPHCYLEVAFLRLFLKIISSPDCPVSPIALIHVRQTITVYSSLQLQDLSGYTLEAHISEIRVVDKGVEIDLMASAYSLLGKVLVWQGVTTLLSRNKQTQSRRRQGRTLEEVTRAMDAKCKKTIHMYIHTCQWYN